MRTASTIFDRAVSPGQLGDLEAVLRRQRRAVVSGVTGTPPGSAVDVGAHLGAALPLNVPRIGMSPHRSRPTQPCEQPRGSRSPARRRRRSACCVMPMLHDQARRSSRRDTSAANSSMLDARAARPALEAGLPARRPPARVSRVEAVDVLARAKDSIDASRARPARFEHAGQEGDVAAAVQREPIVGDVRCRRARCSTVEGTQ